MFFSGKQEEEELVILLSRGDVYAFERIYKTLNQSLFRYVMYLTKSQHIAEEIVQELFVRLWEKRTNFSPDTSLVSYTKQMAANMVFDIFRKASRDSKLFAKILDGAAQIPETHPVEEKELLTAYQAAVRKLPFRQQQVFLLSRDQQLTYQQIAEKLQLSPNTVRNQMADALRSVRLHVARHAEIPLMVAAVYLEKIFPV